MKTNNMVDQADDIRRQMAAIRHELNEDVDEVVQSAKELVDWRNFVRAHPWLTVSAAVAAGFLLVPRRLQILRPDPEVLEDLVKRKKLVVDWKPERAKRAGVISPLVNLLAGVAVRSLATAAGHHAVRLMSGDVDSGSQNGSATGPSVTDAAPETTGP